MTAVLCVCRSSPYWDLACEPWDEERDAMKFAGPGPVVAHPPCRRFGKLRQFVVSVDDRELVLASHCVAAIRRWGGVLEHPAFSLLWQKERLPLPAGGRDAFGGWTLMVSQRWFGHRADKPTWLYLVGVEPHEVPATPFQLYGAGCVPVEFMGKAERERTPREMAEWLLKIASAARPGCVVNAGGRATR